ncbi:MAG: Mov34/MPN/PAD-1 family protein [Betaproteobacteria bacterium]|nr:Mov34/MPN/PAD-1 family protein [Betaproteobacteria bacterium]
MAPVIPRLTIGHDAVVHTIARIRQRGERGAEGVMLWLGRRSALDSDVREAYEPLYRSKADQFVVPHGGMSALMDRICATGHAVVAQVHSHPERAFHSLADETWALVKHTGAYSIVLPWFCAHTTPENFWQEAAVFVMQPSCCWLELSATEKERLCLMR